MSSTKQLRKVGIDEVRELMDCSSFDKGYRPDLVTTKKFLAAFGTYADDADIEIVLKDLHKEMDKFEEMFDSMFTEDGKFDSQGLKDIFSVVVDNMFKERDRND